MSNLYALSTSLVFGLQEEAYRKSLLISRKDKREMGFEVKLKKQAVTDS